LQQQQGTVCIGGTDTDNTPTPEALRQQPSQTPNIIITKERQALWGGQPRILLLYALSFFSFSFSFFVFNLFMLFFLFFFV
jgi:hypothetical protein